MASERCGSNLNIPLGSIMHIPIYLQIVYWYTGNKNVFICLQIYNSLLLIYMIKCYDKKLRWVPKNNNPAHVRFSHQYE